MAHPLASRKRALTFSAILFLISLIALLITGNWWPGIMLAVGLPFALRQYLMGRSYDAAVSITAFVGTFVTVSYDISWEVFLPVLFTLGAIWLCLASAYCHLFEARVNNHKIDEKKK